MIPSDAMILEATQECPRDDHSDGAVYAITPAAGNALPRPGAGKKPLSWDLHSLSKAYQQGYLAGTMGMVRDSCPYHSAVVAAAWEGGWEDGVAERDFSAAS